MSERIDPRLIEGIRHGSLALVERFLPYERSIFDVVWKTYWDTTLPEGQLADEQLSTDKHNPVVRRLGAFGDASVQATDTLYLIATLARASLELLALREEGEMEIDDVARIIRAEALRIGAPERIRALVGREGVQLIAGQLGVAPEAPIAGRDIQSTATESLYLEWREAPESESELPDNGIKVFTPAEVEAKFEVRKQEFQLWIDERRVPVGILIHVQVGRSIRPKVIPWSNLQARHRLLLGMVLDALRNGDAISYIRIARRILGHEGKITEPIRVAIRRAKSELNKEMEGFLNPVLVANRRQDQYEVRDCISYCWIRHGKSESRLLPSP